MCTILEYYGDNIESLLKHYTSLNGCGQLLTALHATLLVILTTLASCSARDWFIVEYDSAKEGTKNTRDDDIAVVVHEQQHDDVTLAPLDGENQSLDQMFDERWVSNRTGRSFVKVPEPIVGQGVKNRLE